MKNENSTDGLAEDLIRSFTQLAIVEMHYKTLIEKNYAELENNLIDTDDCDVLIKHQIKLDGLLEDLETVAELRRDDMRYLFALGTDKKDETRWCTVKHLAIATMTAFEVYQASDNDLELLQMAINKNKLFVKELSRFLGMEITDCAACFADMMKGNGKDVK